MSRFKSFIDFSLLLLILSSCDTVFDSRGVIIDSATAKPVDHARIIVKGFDTIYSDSAGKFKIQKIISGVWTQREIMIEKNGYIPKYVNFNNDMYDHDSAVIKLQPAKEAFKPVLPRKAVKFMYWFNKIVLSLFNVFTLIFIIFKKGIRKKYLWIIGVLFLNFTFYFLYLDLSLSRFRPINGPIYLTNYWMYPYSVKIVIPVITIAFWILYFFKRNWIMKKDKLIN